jgi:hypothetical protein
VLTTVCVGADSKHNKARGPDQVRGGSDPGAGTRCTSRALVGSLPPLYFSDRAACCSGKADLDGDLLNRP